MSLSLASASPVPPSRRMLYLGTAVLGLAWNAYGALQFLQSLGANPQSLMNGGFTAAQAALYLSLPAWMSVVFALGVFGGLAASLALAARRRAALPISLASLAGYIALFAGDAGFGLFDAIPQQLAILSLVLAIALALAAVCGQARRSGWLR